MARRQRRTREKPAFQLEQLPYRQLRNRLEKDPGLALTSSVPPLELTARVARQRPIAFASADRVVELYLQESFGGRELSDEERRELKQVLKESLKSLSRREPPLKGDRSRGPASNPMRQ